jgi:REP element-mobilizing transposase RayT
MPRPLRVHVANAFYHATLRGNHRQDIFREDGDRRLLNAIVARSLAMYDARIHAYCWMSNHLHLLVQVGHEPLGSLMRQIASGYARAFQLKLETTGHLFERRYFARMVRADAYLLAVLRYIHRNPVHAGIVVRAEDHPWSSHNAYSGGGTEPWLTTGFALAMFAEHRPAAHAAYRKFMTEGDAAWTPDDDAVAEVIEAPITQAEGPWTPPGGCTQTINELLAEACVLFGVTVTLLRSPSREPDVVLARGWIGREAVARRVASLSEISRVLGRDRSTLRYAIRRLAVSRAPAPIAG